MIVTPDRAPFRFFSAVSRNPLAVLRFGYSSSRALRVMIAVRVSGRQFVDVFHCPHPVRYVGRSSGGLPVLRPCVRRSVSARSPSARYSKPGYVRAERPTEPSRTGTSTGSNITRCHSRFAFAQHYVGKFRDLYLWK